MTIQTAIRKLERAADRLIPSHGDPSVVSRAFGYGKTEQDARVHAGIILQNLASELWCDMVNNGRIQ